LTPGKALRKWFLSTCHTLPFYATVLGILLSRKYSMYALFLMAPPPGADGTSGGAASSLMTFLPFVLIIGIFYFLIIRPQNKKQKETQKMLAALKKGDKVVTIGGIHGVITSVKENSVIVRVDDSAKLEFSRSAVSSIESVAKEEKIEDKSDESTGNK
jgi:preprotein translocase subunit YajC